jgi:hypothetical protein
MNKKTTLLDLAWIVPASLALGAVLSVLSGGAWWIGWLAYSFVLMLGLFVLTILWRSAGGERTKTLGVIILLAFLLRLSLGMALSYVLPTFGNKNPADKAGYVFRDAYNRDKQAWNLASSSDPIWKAFDKSYSADQYGGLLAFSALIYRSISPDAHRPWLVILVAALTAAGGVALAWKAARHAWGESISLPVAWIMALYPESVLLGASQMREPFLITFAVMFLWGILDWQNSRHRTAWVWMGTALAGMLLVSPGMAVFALLGLGGWAWLKSEDRRIPWRFILIGVVALVAALALLWLGLSIGWLAGASPLRTFSIWLQWTAKWDAFVLERNSGWIQQVFKQLPQPLHMPFMTGYGLTQPLLPAAIFDATVWPWTTINILLAVGWYALLPFLVLGLVAVWKMPEKKEGRAWIWLWVLTWFWIILSSLRAGGDQWDNPRYRSWFLIWQALLAAQALVWWKQARSPWMGRIFAIEAVFLVFFGIWYSSRYGTWANQPLHIFIILAAVVLASGLILIGGWIQDFIRKRKQNRA